jgi:hypothetical protein
MASRLAEERNDNEQMQQVDDERVVHSAEYHMGGCHR